MLEAQNHDQSVFATLTYEIPPEGNTLVKQHLSETLHRLRERLRVLRRTCRFFGVGEYGEIGARPHYHAAIFGIGPEDHDLLKGSWERIDQSDVPAKPGFIHLGNLTPDSANYLAGYVTKKLTEPSSPLLQGRAPEFGLMSRRPGLGSGSIGPLIEALNTSAGALLMGRLHDVPTAFSVGGRLMPLGPYIRSHLRLFFFGEKTQPKAAKEYLLNEAIRENSIFVPDMPIDPSLFERISFPTSDQAELVRLAQAAYIQKKEVSRKQRTRNITARHKIKSSRRIL